MGLLLIILGLVLWLAFGLFLIGIILIVLGFAVFFVPAAPYGYSHWHGRRAP